MIPNFQGLLSEKYGIQRQQANTAQQAMTNEGLVQRATAAHTQALTPGEIVMQQQQARMLSAQAAGEEWLNSPIGMTQAMELRRQMNPWMWGNPFINPGAARNATLPAATTTAGPGGNVVDVNSGKTYAQGGFARGTERVGYALGVSNVGSDLWPTMLLGPRNYFFGGENERNLAAPLGSPGNSYINPSHLTFMPSSVIDKPTPMTTDTAPESTTTTAPGSHLARGTARVGHTGSRAAKSNALPSNRAMPSQLMNMPSSGMVPQLGMSNVSSQNSVQGYAAGTPEIGPAPGQTQTNGVWGAGGQNQGLRELLRLGVGLRPSPQPAPMPAPKPAGYAGGGVVNAKKGTTKVPGKGPPNKDSVNAKLAPNEAVLNAPAADMAGRGLIAYLNALGQQQMGMAPAPAGVSINTRPPGRGLAKRT